MRALEWPKLKNIMIVILLALNAFLLVLVAFREAQGARADERALQSAVVMLENHGIFFDPALFPAEALPPLRMERDRAAERAAAEALLGETQEAAQGSSALFSGTRGYIRFSRTGEFSARLETGALPLSAEQTLAQQAGAVCAAMGFETETLQTQLTAAGVTRVTLRQTAGGAPVFSCLISADFDADGLTALSGVRLTAAPAEDRSSVSALSNVTLLVRFWEGLDTLGDVCTQITAITPGYTFSAGLTDPVALTPVWLVQTDTASYYLNAVTGALQRAG